MGQRLGVLQDFWPGSLRAHAGPYSDAARTQRTPTRLPSESGGPNVRRSAATTARATKQLPYDVAALPTTSPLHAPLPSSSR